MRPRLAGRSGHGPPAPTRALRPPGRTQGLAPALHRGARTMRRPLLAAAAVLLALVLAGLWLLARSRTLQLAGDVVARVETDAPVVALTLDDGPTRRHTDAVLAVLREEGVRATFYVTGASLQACPECGRALVQAGHALGNHTWSHRRMVAVSEATVAREVEDTDAAIRRAGWAGPITFRAPGCKKLWTLPRYLARTGRTHVTFDVEPETELGAGASAQALVDDALARVRPGSIVLLHVMMEARGPSREALRPLVRGLRARGYRFVTVPELLALRR